MMRQEEVQAPHDPQNPLPEEAEEEEQQRQLLPRQRQRQRDLYEQSPSRKTLFFSTSTSSKLPLVNSKTAAYTGIYQCTLEPDDNFDDFNDDDSSRDTCHEASRLADWRSYRGAKHSEFVLRNLQFDLSSLRTSGGTGTSTTVAARKNYLYANSHRRVGHSDTEESLDWDIVRAELPNPRDFLVDDDDDVLNVDGTLKFESFFHTKVVLDSWNECEFDCCVRYDAIHDRWESSNNKDNKDSGNDDGANEDHKHAYVRTILRSFVVDEHTGDVFVSWEGFYKDCGDAFATSKTPLRWTIGVSRLKTNEDAANGCTLQGYSEDGFRQIEHSFARCTEPVSIVYQSTTGRDVVLPFGGFAVVPASSTGGNNGNSNNNSNSNSNNNSNNNTTQKRSFLLSVLQLNISDENPGVTSRVWAFPEGMHSVRDRIMPQEVTGPGRPIDPIFFDTAVWDGGTLRLHYNPKTGTPDHLCRSVYEEGIECLPIQVSIADGTNGDKGMIPLVEPSTPQASPTIFLSGEQTARFCRLGDADKTHRFEWGRRTTLVSGLDVRWDESTGLPQRVFFGCWGGEGGNGNFGSVEAHGDNLVRILDGAYVDTVMFLPKELEGTVDPPALPPPSESKELMEARIAAARAKPNTHQQRHDWHGSWLMVAVALVGVGAVFLAIYRRTKKIQRLLRQQHAQPMSPSALEERTGFRTPYVELRNIDDGCTSGSFDAAYPASATATGTVASGVAATACEEELGVIL